jgi:trans-L-3-hydroxyproline dehydratase
MSTYDRADSWNPPRGWQSVTAIEAHTGGEPLRIVTSGLPEIPGETMLAKRRFAEQHLDHLRTGLMWEPRGHPDMYGAILTEPVTPDGDMGVLFLHNEGFSTMCGHGVIALTKVALDTKMVEKNEEAPVLRIDTPAGRVTATAKRKDNLVSEVSFRNVPSFVYLADYDVDVPGIGPVTVDLAFGGAFYAFCDANRLNVSLSEKNHDLLIDLGRKIKQAVAQSQKLEHPFEDDLGFLYGVIIVGPAGDSSHHSRNVCIFAEGEVDRSPTGTGVSARSAIHHSRGELEVGQPITIESILGTCMTVRIEEVTQFGTFPAVIPSVTGRAHITGKHTFCFDPEDPIRDGFILR